LGPARTAEEWNELILVPGKIVDGLAIKDTFLSVGSPVHGLGNVGLCLVEHGLLGFGKGWRRSLPSLGGSPAAMVRLLLHEAVGLRHQVGLSNGVLSVGVVVLRVVPFSISGHVLYRLCPVVDGVGPGAVALDGHVVLASDESEEAFFTPVSSPRVPDSPVLLSVLNAPTDNGDIVIGLHDAGSVSVNASVVVGDKVVSGGNSASDWAVREDLKHHRVLAVHASILVDGVFVELVGDDARFVRAAVEAPGHGGAVPAVVVASSSVDGTSLISDLAFLDIFPGRDGVSSMATMVWVLTGDKNLRRDIDIGPSTASCDLNSIRHHRGSGLSPAGAAVTRNVLLFDVCQVGLAVDVSPVKVVGEVVW